MPPPRQQELHGHRGSERDLLYAARRTLQTGAVLLTERQQDRLESLFAGDWHIQVEYNWGIHQRDLRLPPPRADHRPRRDELRLRALADGVPKVLDELRKPGRTVRVCDVLAYFDRTRTSDGPAEAGNGRLSTCAAWPAGSAT